MRLDIRRIGALKDGEQVVGNRTRVKVVKNKLAAPFRETEFDVGYGQGISRAGEIIDLGVEAGLLEKSGAWIAHGGERLGNGREAAKQYLLDHQDLLRELRTKLLERNGIGVARPAAVEGEPAAGAAPVPAAVTPARPAAKKAA